MSEIIITSASIAHQHRLHMGHIVSLYTMHKSSMRYHFITSIPAPPPPASSPTVSQLDAGQPISTTTLGVELCLFSEVNGLLSNVTVIVAEEGGGCCCLFCGFCAVFLRYFQET